MSATQRLWSPSSFDHANQQQIAPTNENGSRLMSVRRPGASSPAVAAPHVPAPTHARPQQQPTSYQQQQQQQSYFSPPSSYTTLSTQPNSYFPSVVPSISTQSTPILIAKELPLAPPTPSTNPILLPNSMYYIHPGSASPSPSPARQLPMDAHRPLLYRQQTPTQYPSSHSRSNSFSSSTNNAVTSNSSAGYPPVLTIPVSSSTLSSPISSSQMSSPHPTTPKSRRTSLITTSLATAIHNNLALVAAANGGMSSNGTASVGMSPQSSYGLPSPTFPPRTLPFSGANNGSVVTPATPSRPPRSPARPPAGFGAQGALGLSPLTPLPFPASSSSPTPAPGTVTAISNHNQAIHPPHPLSASTAPSHNYSAPIPRAPRQSLTQSQSQAHALSRRNSRQVSVRLSAAFVPPSLTPRSRSGSVSGSRVGSVAGHARRMSRVGSMVDNGESEGLDILKAGDIIGRGCLLRGQIVRAVQPVAPQEPVNKSVSSSAHVCANARYEVVRSLGTGSYAVVYLVREILPPPTPVKTPSALGLSSLSDDIFDEDDFFGLSQPPIQVFPPSRTLSNKSNIVRRPSVLKPIDELLPSSAPSSGPSSSSGSTSSSSAPGTPPSAQAQSQPQYGREFAIKVLSKRNLAADELAVQRTEVSIHQSLRAHGNIVTLYGALETEELLMLVLEYVRGEDLYYFLETEQIGEGEAQDNSSRRSSMYSSYSALSEDGEMTLDELLDEPARGRRRTRRPRQDSQHQPSTGTTPPTPSLLSNVHPNAMLSYDRLRLIASMFAQMCDAVQACHAQGISHRDIKPENFIVTTTSDDTDKANSMGKVIVKLSDFGLATTDRWSADVDCGSAPYMSYECRNVVGPTYATQPADVWSLGIVLINMLYHHNLWQDTFEGDASFEAFRQQPIPFLMQRSPGMTRDVAEFLAERVFSIMPEAPADEEDPALLAEYEHQTEHVRVTAAEFGEWARQLPAMFFNAGINANPLAGAADVQEQLPAPVVGTVSAVSAVSRRLSAAFPHSPNCVHSQLHFEHQHTQALLAHVSTGADEDEDEAAAMLDVTLTQSDFGDDYLGIGNARADDLNTANLVAQYQSSPSMSSPAPRSPRSPRSPPIMARTMTPLPAEPMPLAQPVVDVRLSDLGGGRASPLGLSTNGDCLACTYDEHIGLGLTGAPVLSVAEIIDGDSEEGKRMRSRKRGQRRKKDPSAPPSNVSSPLVTAHTVLPNVNSVVAVGKQFDLDDLAQGMQDFAREVSRTRPVSVTRPRSTSRSRSRAPVLPPLPNSTNVPSPLNPHPLYHSVDMVSPLDNPAIDPSTPSLPPSVASAVVSHKKSKLGWLASRRDADEPEDQSERASSLLKGLDSTLRPSGPNTKSHSQTTSSGSGKSFQTNSQGSVGSTSIAFTPPPLPQGMPTGPDAASWRGRPQQQQQQQQQRGRDPPSTAFRNALNDRRERSPASSTYSGRSIATTVPSWRNSANTSSSAASSMYNGSVPSSSASSTFTRFRNGSEASFATTATTVSAASTFNTGGIGGVVGSEKKAQGPVARPPSVKNHAEPGPPKPQQRRHPVNVKQMHGIPWELDELPRQMQPTVNGKMPMGDVHGAPPRRGKRNGGPTPKPPALDTISERPKGIRRPTSPGGGESGESDSGGPLSPPVVPEPLAMAPPKKVQKGQINSLAKLLTSFNRSKKD